MRRVNSNRTAFAVMALTGVSMLAVLAMTGTTLAQSDPVAKTQSGDVRGTMSQYNDSIYVFKGIPYADDTSGANRFRAPQPVKPWTDVRDATTLASACPNPGFPPPPFAQEEGDDLDKSPMGEDCLGLNIWTPGLKDGKKRPVMVFFHGGGFSSGSGGSLRYDGTNLAAKQDVVLITTNHRLNIFGYLDLADVDPSFAPDANAGMQDIVQSLRWIRDNIEEFGGDPDNVTVFGQSGGGSKVTTLMAMPSAKGLFDKVIAESGVNLVAGTKEEATALAKDVVEKLGASSDLAALQSVSMEEIQKASTGGKPWVDGTILPADPFGAKASDVSADIPLMIGWTLAETTFFSGPMDDLDDAQLLAKVKETTKTDDSGAQALVDAYRQTYPNAPQSELLLAMQADYGTGKKALTTADLKSAQGGAPVYVYHFEGRTEVRNLVSPHTVEIAYVFDNLDISKRMNGEVTPEKQELADMVSTAWANFARNGVPSAPGLPEWKPYDSGTKNIMILDNQPELVAAPKELEALLGD